MANTSKSVATAPHGSAHCRFRPKPPPGDTVTWSPLLVPPLASKFWQLITGSSNVGHGVGRKAGDSYDETLLPPTITFEFPAAEK